MENVFNYIFNILATTIGVVLAFFLSKQNERWQEAKEAKNLKDRIKNELEAISGTVCSIQEDRDKLLLTPIKMPVYHGAVNSLKIVLLSKYEWYDDLLHLYETLETYNAWHELKTNKVLDNDFENSLPMIKDMFLTIEKGLLDSNDFIDDSANDIMSDEALVDGLDGLLSMKDDESETVGQIGSIITKLVTSDMSVRNKLRRGIGNMITKLVISDKFIRNKLRRGTV